jgi:hypothetical protein
LVDRIPPQSLEAEMATLGSILVDRAMLDVVASIVEPDDFYAHVHELVYRTMLKLARADRPIDKVTLADLLGQRNHLERVGGIAYISGLMDVVPTAASATYYATIVRQKAQLRGLISAGTEITRAGFEGEDDVEAAVARAEAALKGTLGRGVDTTVCVIADAAELVAAPLEGRRFLVEPLIPERAIVLLSGDTGAAKSAFALHIATAVASGALVAQRFATTPLSVLYVNGEMEPSTIVRYLREAVPSIPKGRLFFEGADGFACFRFDPGGTSQYQRAFTKMVGDLRPALIVFDTQRALLVDDENEAAEVRRAFGWIRSALVAPFGCSALVLHHLRKIGSVSNTARERVSGSRDILASVDVHLAAKAREGRALHALVLDKTRSPIESAPQGTEWPIEARLEFGEPNRSVFIAGDPQRKEGGDAVNGAMDEIRALLEIGPKTVRELGARDGARKRAYDQLRRLGEVTSIESRGREKLMGLAGRDYAGQTTLTPLTQQGANP